MPRSHHSRKSPVETMLEDCDLSSLPCLERDLHVIGYIVTPPGFSCFSITGGFVIPWNWILNYVEKSLLFQRLCPNTMIPSHRHACYTDAGVFSLHCHCKDMLSLLCMAGARVRYAIMRGYIHGSCFNSMFMFYRLMANRGLSDDLSYVGSVLHDNVHYIYIRIRHEKTMRMMKAALRDSDRYWFCLPFWLVLRCITCGKHPTELMAKCCAKSINRFLRRWSVAAGCSQRPSLQERSRYLVLKRSLTHGECEASYCRHIF